MNYITAPGIINVIKRQKTIAEIIDLAAEFFQLERKIITGKGRYRHLVDARFVICLVLRGEQYSLSEIGQALGGRDHSTVIHSLQQIQNLIDTDTTYQKRVNDFKQFCKIKQHDNNHTRTT